MLAAPLARKLLREHLSSLTSYHDGERLLTNGTRRAGARSSADAARLELLGEIMLSWALTFFVVAIIAAVLGFSSIAGAAASIAKVLFFIFLVLTLVALVAGAIRGRVPPA